MPSKQDSERKTAPWDRMDRVLNYSITFLYILLYILFFIVGVVGKTCELAAKTGGSERNQLFLSERVVRELRKGP